MREMQGEELRMLRKELQRLQNRDKLGCSAGASAEPKRLQSKDRLGCSAGASTEPKRLLSKDRLGCSGTANGEETEKRPNNEPGESRESVVL